DLTAAEASQTYADHVARLLARLAEGFGDGSGADTVNLVTAHLTVVGGMAGGGEREAHTIMGYAVPATVFPASAHYVALGHLHRALEVRVDPRLLPDADAARPRARRTGRSAGELFADYLAEKGHADEATVALFHRLHGEVTG